MNNVSPQRENSVLRAGFLCSPVLIPQVASVGCPNWTQKWCQRVRYSSFHAIHSMFEGLRKEILKGDTPAASALDALLLAPELLCRPFSKLCLRQEVTYSMRGFSSSQSHDFAR